MSTSMGQRIKSKRKKAKLSQDKLAQRIGVTQNTISRWESDRTVPDREELNRLKKIIGGINYPKGQKSSKPLKSETNNEASALENNIAQKNSDGINTQPEENAIAVWLQTKRIGKNLTVQSLAEQAKIPASTIYALESGRITNPQRKTIAKLENALQEKIGENITDETSRYAVIEGMGNLIGFDPHDQEQYPTCAGVYVFYDISDRPIYVGQSSNIQKRIKQHFDRFWFKAPIVSAGSFIQIDNKELRSSIEGLLIKFLKSNAVLNTRGVENR